MSSWDDKVKALQSALDVLKSTKPKVGVCIHGEENCARCAVDEMENGEIAWEALVGEDLRKVVFALPEEIQKMMRKHPGQVVVAGGFIRALVANEDINDIDVFIDTETNCKKWADDEDLDYESREKHLYLEGEEGEPEIQIIWRYPFKQPVEIPDSFDYTVCKAAVWFSNGDKNRPPGFVGTCHKNFYRDIARRMLVYETNRDTERLESIPRLIKYIAYGYAIEPKSLAEVVSRTVVNLKLDAGFEGLQKQLEEAYKPMGHNDEWQELNKVYVKPKPRKKKKPAPVSSRNYTYGS